MISRYCDISRIFIGNLRIAEQLTATGTSTHGVTKFMDLTPQEFQSMYTNVNIKGLRASLRSALVSENEVRGCLIW